MYSDAALGHGSVLIDFLIEKASSMRTPTLLLSSVLFLVSLSRLIQPIFPNFISSGDKSLRRAAGEAVRWISQQSKKTKRNLSDALIIYPWAGFLFSPRSLLPRPLFVFKKKKY